MSGSRINPTSFFLPYQLAWINDESPMSIWEKSRRIGADYCEAFRCVRERIRGLRTVDYWYSSADESAAKEQAEYIRFFLEMYNYACEPVIESDLVDGKNMLSMTFTLPAVMGPNGRTREPRITVMTSNPTGFRSKGGDVTFSEFAFHKKPAELWKAGAPCVTWGGRFRVLSSHNGEHSLHNQRINQAKRWIDPDTYGVPRASDIRATLHRTDIYEAIEQGLVERINEQSGTDWTRESFLAECRSRCATEADFNEEYGCIPSAESGSFLPYAITSPCVTPKACLPTSEPAQFLADIQARAGDYDELYGGCDVARTNDRFVITVLGKSGLKRNVIGLLVTQGLDFGAMESAIISLMVARFGDLAIRRKCIDSTGLGMQLAERMKNKFRSRIEPVNMTAKAKADMFTRFRAAVEERTIGLPDDPTTLADIGSIRKELTAAGNERYAADSTADGHADRATGIALALVAAEGAKAPMRQVKMTGGVV